jgi:hypothetical protein
MTNGHYITFIDSIDFLTMDYVETLLYFIDKFQCEISVSQFMPHKDGDLDLISQPEEKEYSLNTF